MKHAWTRAGGELPIPQKRSISLTPLLCEMELDIDVLASMTSLGCFKEKNQLVEKLLSQEINTEKYIYHLLLSRKMRFPTTEDDEASFPVCTGEFNNTNNNSHNLNVVTCNFSNFYVKNCSTSSCLDSCSEEGDSSIFLKVNS